MKQDFAISPEALRRQAAVARDHGRAQLAANFERGAELTALSEAMIFEIYELLRPGRAESATQLVNFAVKLREHHDAPHVAALIEEAALVYERRKLFRKRY